MKKIFNPFNILGITAQTKNKIIFIIPYSALCDITWTPLHYHLNLYLPTVCPSSCNKLKPPSVQHSSDVKVILGNFVSFCLPTLALHFPLCFTYKVYTFLIQFCHKKDLLILNEKGQILNILDFQKLLNLNTLFYQLYLI